MTKVYTQTYYGVSNQPIRDKSLWFSHCCGATFIPEPTEKVNVRGSHKGIKVWPGAIGKPYKGRKQQVDHVVTRNGTLTVSVRHEF